VVAVRARTRELLTACCEAERRYFRVYCDLERKNPPAAKVAERDRLWRLYHAAVERLRGHVDRDRKLALAEQMEIAAAYVFGEDDLERELAHAKGAEARDRIRRRHVERRMFSLDDADEIACGLGWPHRGEKVIVDGASYYPGNAVFAGRYEHRGEAIYKSSYSTMNTSHTVRVPEIDHDLLVEWRPQLDEHWGPADPDGDIPMRLASAPDRPLPPPLPRFPTAEWLGPDAFQLKLGVDV
jgi:hypothetical protein